MIEIQLMVRTSDPKVHGVGGEGDDDTQPTPSPEATLAKRGHFQLDIPIGARVGGWDHFRDGR